MRPRSPIDNNGFEEGMVCGRVLPSFLITGERGWWVARPHSPIDNNEFEVGRDGLRPRIPLIASLVNRGGGWRGRACE